MLDQRLAGVPRRVRAVRGDVVALEAGDRHGVKLSIPIDCGEGGIIRDDGEYLLDHNRPGPSC
jgi:hypothetical protein